MSDNRFLSLIDKHLKLTKNFSKTPAWEVNSINSNVGRGLFANRDIEAGEIIFTDSPLLIGPRASKLSVGFCVKCYAQTNFFCSNDCSLPVCSKKCELSDAHFNECVLLKQWKLSLQQNLDLDILRCLTPIRSFFLNDYQKKLLLYLRHNLKLPSFEVELFKKLTIKLSEEEEILFRLACSVLDINAFELVVGKNEEQFSVRGVYPLASMVNHSCIPNVANYFDSNQKMISKATKFIRKGEQLFVCYTKLFWSTFLRQPYLFKTKKFICDCERCRDPSEFQTNLGGVNCLGCNKSLSPNAKDGKFLWKCETCNKILSFDNVRVMSTMIANRIDACEENVEKILDFLKKDYLKYFPCWSYLGISIKCKLVWILGYEKNYLWKDLSDELLSEKELICRDLLKVLEMLRAGKCKLRGLLLYELYACLSERQKRLEDQNDQNNNLESRNEEMKIMFEESKEILMHDVHAPQEIKMCIA